MMWGSKMTEEEAYKLYLKIFEDGRYRDGSVDHWYLYGWFEGFAGRTPQYSREPHHWQNTPQKREAYMMGLTDGKGDREIHDRR